MSKVLHSENTSLILTSGFPELVTLCTVICRKFPHPYKDSKMDTQLDFCRGMSRPENWYSLLRRDCQFCMLVCLGVLNDRPSFLRQILLCFQDKTYARNFECEHENRKHLKMLCLVSLFLLFHIQQTDAARKTDIFCLCYASKTKQNLANIRQDIIWYT